MALADGHIRRGPAPITAQTATLALPPAWLPRPVRETILTRFPLESQWRRCLCIGLAIFLGSLARAHWNIFSEDLDATGHSIWPSRTDPGSRPSGWAGWPFAGRTGQHFAAGGEEFNRVFMAASPDRRHGGDESRDLSQYELSRGFVTMTFLIGTPVLLVQTLFRAEVAALASPARGPAQSGRGRG